jgi:hypothetical protein
MQNAQFSSAVFTHRLLALGDLFFFAVPRKRGGELNSTLSKKTTKILTLIRPIRHQFRNVGSRSSVFLRNSPRSQDWLDQFYFMMITTGYINANRKTISICNNRHY